jgi:pimeloyl-ACP methyl ester carboxylesterase
MTAVETRGLRLHYTSAGSGDPSFLLVHGWNSNSRSMASLADALGRQHRVVNVDLRGHGESSGGEAGYGPDDISADLAAVAADAGLVRPVLVGHSLGAKFVLACAAARPAAASAVVLLDTSIRETAERRAARRAEVEGGSADPGFRARIEGMFRADDDTPERAETLATMIATPQGVARAALAAGDAIDTAAALRACAVPVLYIGASSPREDEAVLRELRPDIAYGRVVESGHFVQYEGLDQVVAMIERFMQTLAARR